MAPGNGTTSTPPKLIVTLPPNQNTLQWHPTLAPSNGTTSTAPCNGTLVPRPIRQSGSSPSPLIGSKNPYSYRYLGNKKESERALIVKDAFDMYLQRQNQESTWFGWIVKPAECREWKQHLSFAQTYYIAYEFRSCSRFCCLPRHGVSVCGCDDCCGCCECCRFGSCRRCASCCCGRCWYRWWNQLVDPRWSASYSN